MSSQSFREFKYGVQDAKRLHQVHGLISKGTPGKKGLGHITRSGVVMLCAAWEQYHESLLLEGVEFLSRNTVDPKNLPKTIQQYLSTAVKIHKHQLRPMDLAGEGWRTVFKDVARENTNALNTPKSENLKVLYKRLLGIPDVTSLWGGESQNIDLFISVRGEISHRGRHANYIQAWELSNYITLIYSTAARHDNLLCEELKNIGHTAYQPWNKTA